MVLKQGAEFFAERVVREIGPGKVLLALPLRKIHANLKVLAQETVMHGAGPEVHRHWRFPARGTSMRTKAQGISDGTATRLPRIPRRPMSRRGRIRYAKRRRPLQIPGPRLLRRSVAGLAPVEFLEEPGADHRPVALDGARAHPEGSPDFLHAQPAEEAVLENPGVQRVQPLEFVEHFPHEQDLVRTLQGDRVIVPKLEAHAVPAA